MRFDELDLSDDILDALNAMRFEECTPVQELAIPKVLEGRDLIAVAQTGTGKTAAYLLPVIDRLYRLPEPEESVNCIVMAPTRELAQQIDCQMEGFSYYLPLTSVAIYGGTDGKTFAQQQKALKLGADVVIATPGRLIAHMQMGYVDLSKVSYLILDEADRMLDMGFYDDIMTIVKQMPENRQTLMFSATMPARIQQLAKAILHDPAEVKIAVSKPTEAIQQSAFVVYEPQKPLLIEYLLKKRHASRVIIFASSKLNVKDLTRILRRAGLKAAEIHSDLDQNQRDEVMQKFRANRIDILVATDILARGIDIDDISLVVNYDVPHEAEDYVHRIGRTARAGAGGEAITFISPREQQKFGSIEKFLGYEVRKEEVPEKFGETPEYHPERRGAGKGRPGRGGRPNQGNRNARPAQRGGGRRDKNRRSDSNAQAPSQRHNSHSENPKTAAQPANASAAVNASAAGQQPRKRNNRRHYRSKDPGNSTPPQQ